MGTIISLNKKVYNYLQKNDTEWLKETNDTIRDRYKSPVFKPRRDYAMLDKELKKSIKIKLKELKSLNPPYRLSISRVILATSHEGYLALEGDFKYYPLSKDFLDKNCESLIGYQIRRIWNCAERMHNKKLILTKGKLINRGNLYHKLYLLST